MSGIALCTDSSALFPEGVAERLQVIVVPISVLLEGSPYDERELSLDEFYARLASGAQATTSQPNPSELLAAYAAAAANGSEAVLSIHLDARISGAVAAAELAAREASIPVAVVDSRTASFGVGRCVRAAAEAVAAGASLEEAAATARRFGATMRNAFVAPDGPRGRVPETPGWTLLELADGTVESIGACESTAMAISAMTARVKQEQAHVRAAVGHAGAAVEAAADDLAGSLASLAGVVDVERYRVGAAVGAHTGALSFGAFWWPAP